MVIAGRKGLIPPPQKNKHTTGVVSAQVRDRGRHQDNGADRLLRLPALTARVTLHFLPFQVSTAKVYTKIE